MKSFHTLFFFIALLLFFFSSASPDSFLNPLFHTQQHLKNTSFSFDNLPENVGQLHNGELKSIEVAIREIQKLTNRLQENSVDEMKATEDMIETDKKEAIDRRNEILNNLRADFYYLKNEDTVTITGKVANQVAVLMDGKKMFESGGRSEYSWEVIWKESSVENLLIGHPKMIRQEHYDDIPDLFMAIVLPMEPGRQVLKFREWSDKDGSIRSTRTVNIECQTSNFVFVNNRKEREINVLLGSQIYFFMRVIYEKPDYNWVIHSTGTSPTLHNSPIVDIPNAWSDYLLWYPLQYLTVTPLTPGTNMLQLSYQDTCGDYLQASTITIKVKNEDPEYNAAKEAAWKVYNYDLSRLPANSYINEDTAHINGRVGQEQFVIVDGKHQFENQTMNEYVWEPDIEESSKCLFIDTSSLFRRTLCDEIPDLFKIRFIPIEQGHEILKLQYIRRRDMHVRATRTITINSQIDTMVFINDVSTRNIESVVNKEITLFLKINPNKPDYKWEVDSSVTSKTLRIGKLVDTTLQSLTATPNWFNYQTTKNVKISSTKGGVYKLKFNYQDKYGDKRQSSTITITSRNESPQYIAAKEAALKTYNEHKSRLLQSGTFLENGKPTFYHHRLGWMNYVTMDGKKRFENGTLNEYGWEADPEQSKYFMVAPPELYRGESGFDDVPDIIAIRLIEIEEGRQTLKFRYIRSSDKNIRETRSVTINGVLKDVVYINDLPNRTIKSVINREITFFLNIDPDKRDYSWVIDRSATTKSLKIGKFSDKTTWRFENLPTWTNYQKTTNVKVSATNMGASILKFNYQNKKGNIIRECTVTMNVS